MGMENAAWRITYEQAMRNGISVTNSKNSGVYVLKQSCICSWQCSTLAGRAVLSESKCYSFIWNTTNKDGWCVSTDRRTEGWRNSQKEDIHWNRCADDWMSECNSSYSTDILQHAMPLLWQSPILYKHFSCAFCCELDYFIQVYMYFFFILRLNI